MSNRFHTFYCRNTCPELRRSNRPARFIIFAIVGWLCFTTVYYIIENFYTGFWDRASGEMWELNLVWDIFALIDVFLIFLLLRRPTLGIVLTVIFMFVEIYFNNYFHTTLNNLTFGLYDWYKIVEVLLALMLFFSLPILLLSLNHRNLQED